MAYTQYNSPFAKKCNGPAITEKSYEKQNRKMRSEQIGRAHV